MAEHANSYSLTDELRAQLQPWATRWIGNAMSTKPMDDEDRRAMRLAVRGLYEAAGLTPPPDHRIVFVPSPIVLRLAGGFAGAIWAMRPVQNEFNRILRSAGADVFKLAEALVLETAKKAGKACATRFATEETVTTATYRAINGSVTDTAWQETRAATWDAVETANAATFFATNIATFQATHDAAEAAASGAGGAVALRRDLVRRIKATLAGWVNDFVVRNASRAASQVHDSFEMKLCTERATAAATQAATDGATPMRDMVKRINTTFARWVNHFRVGKASRAGSEIHDSFEMNLRTETATVAGHEWYVFGDLLTIATRIMGPSARLGLSCACSATGTTHMWQGGNQCSSTAAFVSFFRHVAGWKIDYSRWHHWEAAAAYGGPRIMHEKFCMISDRPRVLTVDEQNRPHNPNGPLCQWADGSALYAWHGVHTPAKYFLREHSAIFVIGHFENPSTPQRVDFEAPSRPYHGFITETLASGLAPQNTVRALAASNPELWGIGTAQQLAATSKIDIRMSDLVGSPYQTQEPPSHVFRSGPMTGFGETKTFMGGECPWKNVDLESKKKWIQEGTFPNYVFMISPAGETCYIRNPSVDVFLAKGAVKGVPVVRAGIVVGYRRPDVLQESGIETDDKSASPVSSCDLPVEPMACVDEMSSAGDGTSTAKPVDHGQLPMTNEEKLSMEAACLEKHFERQSGEDLYQMTAGTAGPQRRPDLSQWRLGEMQSVQSACVNEKLTEEPAGHNGCLAIELNLWLAFWSPNRPDLLGLSNEEKRWIESACSNAKRVPGPAEDNKCLVR